MKTYVVSRNNKEIGRFTKDELAVELEAGRIAVSDWYFDDQRKDWFSVREIAEGTESSTSLTSLGSSVNPLVRRLEIQRACLGSLCFLTAAGGFYFYRQARMQKEAAAANEVVVAACKVFSDDAAKQRDQALSDVQVSRLQITKLEGSIAASERRASELAQDLARAQADLKSAEAKVAASATSKVKRSRAPESPSEALAMGAAQAQEDAPLLASKSLSELVRIMEMNAVADSENPYYKMPETLIKENNERLTQLKQLAAGAVKIEAYATRGGYAAEGDPLVLAFRNGTRRRRQSLWERATQKGWISDARVVAALNAGSPQQGASPEPRVLLGPAGVMRAATRVRPPSRPDVTLNEAQSAYRDMQIVGYIISDAKELGLIRELTLGKADNR